MGTAANRFVLDGDFVRLMVGTLRAEETKPC
jgi:hypothetical protein